MCYVFDSCSIVLVRLQTGSSGCHNIQMGLTGSTYKAYRPYVSWHLHFLSVVLLGAEKVMKHYICQQSNTRIYLIAFVT